MTALRAVVKNKVHESRPDGATGRPATLDQYGDRLSTEQGLIRIQLAVSKLAGGPP